MNGNYVVLILGVLALAYAVYFTHTVVRPRAATRDSGRSAAFQLGATERKQVTEEVRAAGQNRAMSQALRDADADRAERAVTDSPALRPSRCLWVAHDPDAVVHERRMIELLHVEIDTARTTNQALQFMVGRRYDFIVTDLIRPIAAGGVDERAGMKLLKMLAGAPTVSPVIVYTDHLADDAADPPDAAAPPADDDDEAVEALEADDEADDGADDEAITPVEPQTSDEPPTAAADPRLDDARTAGARAAVTTPGALLGSVLDIVGTS